MDIEALENTTFAAIVEKIQKVRKRGELLESIQGILKKNFETVEAAHQIECQKIRNIIEGIPGELIGNTREMREVSKLVRQIAPTAATVLIRGKAGTGKEYVARSIHELSERKDSPFVALNCDALTEGANSFESELFGFERGAFTGATNRHIGKAEQANGGTLFLDEVADLPLPAQIKLLQFIQEQSFKRLGSNIEQRCNVRLIASTGKNLEAMMQHGKFREDLYYRLNTFHLMLPPLRERKPALPNLIKYFILKNKDAQGKEIVDLEPAALYALTKYPYPGNIRELENIIEHAIVLAEGGVIRLEDLPEDVQECAREKTMAIPHIKGESPEPIEAEVERLPGISFEGTGKSSASEQKSAAEGDSEEILSLEEMERRHILHALSVCGGNKTEVCKRLGISRATLWRKLKELKIMMDGDDA
jgi:DNA-binding NtrC family response regulator